jgi:choline dehydrogenase-like flavoprotein
VELNGRTAPDGTTLETDVCIVGAGPAGIALAHELQARGIQTVLIESGGYTREAELQELNAGESIGDPYEDLRLARSRGPGGTAAIWNTMFQGAVFAKYAPLDSIDFEPRDWIPWSGWPFSLSTLESYYRRAQAICGLGPFDYRGSAWSDEAAPLLNMAGSGLSQTVHQYGPANRFTVTLPGVLGASPSVILLHEATVTQLSGGDRITEARWATLSGKQGAVRASSFVLAAGAIENARLLLLSLQGGTAEAPPDGWLGRGFMEHPVDSSLRLVSRDPALAATPGFYAARSAEPGPVVGRIGLSPDLIRSERLRNASLRLFRDTEPEFIQSSAVRPLAHRLVPSLVLRRLIGGSIRRMHRMAAPLRATTHRVLLDLEQAPHPENCVRLSDRRDSLGLPRAVLHWRWRSEDEAHRSRVRVVFARELERAGAGRLHVVSESPLEPAAHHHAGTTRMHPDPAEGVVDEHLRVHSVENLFVTGSSVFPTAGVANPTLTVIALTVRLADELSRKP